MISPSAPLMQGALSITAVERETGLSKDTLRVWEKRYGFPRPTRNAADDRLYPPEQVQRLKHIRRLMDAGYRPGKIAHLNDQELHALLNNAPDLSKTNKKQEHPSGQLEQLLRTIESHNAPALRDALHHSLMRKGLTSFVVEIVAPLTTAVGEAWAQGRFEVFEEHLYTEVITNVLHNSLSTIARHTTPHTPKVLLTTYPQELHGLGLLMVQTLLSLEGCECVSLGTQTPISDIVRAAAAHRADVVALSFTNLQSASTLQSSLRDLRSTLPTETSIWVGGSCAALYQKPWEGITALQDLEGLPALVAQWRESHATVNTTATHISGPA